LVWDIFISSRAVDLIRRHGGRNISTGIRDALDIAILMHGLSVFVGVQIDAQINWLAANVAW
jgi:hypothetical protein